ncbi:MAG: MAPEG family protein [Gammaproteobacteria bacterium]
MTEELTYLGWLTLITALLWIPYILNMIKVRGLLDAVGYPENPKPMAPWANRMKAAHYNMIENLVIFGLLVLILNDASISNDTTITASVIFFWARIIHVVVYTFAIPWVRTITFLIGFGCQIALALQLL